jgi:hypothetical protein
MKAVVWNLQTFECDTTTAANTVSAIASKFLDVC